MRPRWTKNASRPTRKTSGRGGRMNRWRSAWIVVVSGVVLAACGANDARDGERALGHGRQALKRTVIGAGVGPGYVSEWGWSDGSGWESGSSWDWGSRASWWSSSGSDDGSSWGSGSWNDSGSAGGGCGAGSPCSD